MKDSNCNIPGSGKCCEAKSSSEWRVHDFEGGGDFMQEGQRRSLIR